MSRRRNDLNAPIAVLLALVAAVSLAAPASAYDWPEDNCFGRSWDLTAWSRNQAYAYAQEAVHEGYWFNGGCYKLNDVDDTGDDGPGDVGEGADCSGFVFKTWALKASGGSGYRFWEHEKFIHGPYTTAHYYWPDATDPFKTISKSYNSTQTMDAFVYRIGDSGHIGMIYLEGSGGADYIIHAHCDACGTEISYETYRSQAAYKAITRKNWSSPCGVRCG
jgi:hypothetical protein